MRHAFDASRQVFVSGASPACASQKRISRSLASAHAHALLALVASSTKYTRPLNGTPSEWFDSDISHVRDVE